MFFKNKKNIDLYNTLLHLSRNIHLYKNCSLNDTFETRVYLMFVHFSIILIIFKEKKEKFNQSHYDYFFECIENNIRELGFGDVSVNKKMKELNKIFYDILLKLSEKNDKFTISNQLILKYFNNFESFKDDKFKLFINYLQNFYHFCFELPPQTMIKDAIKFEVK